MFMLSVCVCVCSVKFEYQDHRIKVKVIFVYRMGRLCGGAHEISGIKAPLFLCGGVGSGGWKVV